VELDARQFDRLRGPESIPSPSADHSVANGSQGEVRVSFGASKQNARFIEVVGEFLLQ
jgi:hypothetical protein